MTIRDKSFKVFLSTMMFSLLTAIFCFNSYGQNQAVYWIEQSDLVSATTDCAGTGNNYYGSSPGFTWTDNLPAGTQVLLVEVEYNIGVSCINPNTITPTLNSTNQTSVTYSGACTCSPSSAQQDYITHTLNEADYNVDGSNTYILQGASTTGFNNEPTSLNGNFAKITVTYGADDDAGIDAINLLPSFCAQSQDISVDLKNFGTNNITSANIEWEINGTSQTTVAYSGTLAPNASTAVVLASNFNFTNGEYIITTRTTNPNNTTDGNTTNDAFERTINVGAFPPTNITHTEVTANDVYSISWTGDNTQTYELEYGDFEFSIGSGTRISNIIGTSQNISGIDPSTNGYDVYVRSYCGSTPGNWSQVYSFGAVPFFVSNETELNAALTASVNDDVIVFLNDIVITSQKTISGKTITINGQGYELSVPRPGLDDMGRFNSTPSGYRVLQLSSAANVTINNLTMKGGVADSNGGAILVNSGTILHINNSVVSNTNAGLSNGGGGIAVLGTMFMKNSFVRRNAARYGGGILVTGTGRAYVEESTMVENRSTSDRGGGGAAECQSGSVLYFNNSTLSNNQSTEIGGAINNYQGTVYFINSSATGNVAFGSEEGGAIGNNGGNVYILNSLFAHNYRRTSGSVTDPTGYVLDDFQRSPSGIRIYHSVYHATLPTGLAVNTGNVQYTGAANGADNSIFSGGLLSKITDNDGNEIGDQVFRPFLFNNQGSVAPTLKLGSFVSQTANLGVPTRFSNNINSNPTIAYFSGGTWTNLIGTSASGQEVTNDQVGNTRSSSTPARGAIEDELDETLYIVKVNGASGGTVNGGTIYGDVYPDETEVTLTALANSGQQFSQWDYVDGGSGTASTDNPYTFTVTQDVTLAPVFSSLSTGSYAITYLGNGNTGGSVPSGGTFSEAVSILGFNTLVRNGFEFLTWNTSANGSGTNYDEGDTYNEDTNLTLYAQWGVLPESNVVFVSDNTGGDYTLSNGILTVRGTQNVNIEVVNNHLNANTDLTIEAMGNITFNTALNVSNQLTIKADTDGNGSGSITFNHNVLVSNLTLEGNTATLAAGKQLIVSGNLVNNASLLELNSNSNEFAILDITGSISGTGDIAYNRYVNASPSNDLISAPFSEMNFGALLQYSSGTLLSGAINGQSGFYLFGPHNEQSNSYELFNATANQNTSIGVGKGYRAGSINGSTLSFRRATTGYNTHKSTVDVSLTHTGEGWNLVGNPYPTYLSLSSVYDNNENNLYGDAYTAIYSYNGNATNPWTIYNRVTGTNINIAPGQAFFVRAAEAGSNFSFTPSMQSTTGGDDFIAGRSSTSLDEVYYTGINLSSGSSHYSTQLYFHPNGSNGLDVGYDAANWQNSIPDFGIYSHLVEQNQGLALAIQTLNTTALAEHTVLIPLGVESEPGLDLEISLLEDLNLPLGSALYLEDRELGVFTNLSSSVYSINSQEGLSGTGRFYLHLGSDASLSNTKQAYAGLQVYAPSGSDALVVTGITESGMELTLYDMLGRTLLQHKLSNESLQHIAVGHLSAGPVVVLLRGSHGSRSLKVIINH